MRLATSYILYLIGVLETDEPAAGFRAELGSIGRKPSSNSVVVSDCTSTTSQQKIEISVSFFIFMFHEVYNLTCGNESILNLLKIVVKMRDLLMCIFLQGT